MPKQKAVGGHRCHFSATRFFQYSFFFKYIFLLLFCLDSREDLEQESKAS